MTVTIAILCKQKAHCLPLYLKCILNQTYPKELINIYIRSNNNTDNTIEILKEWISKHEDKYNSIYCDFSDIDQNLEILKPHEWTKERFLILGDIRNKSLQYAYDNNSHYFVADCDNFIIPSTIQDLFNTNLPVIGPLLHRHNHCYSNYHDKVDNDGYMKQTDEYYILLQQQIKSLVAVDVIHCTYFIRYDILPFMNYIDCSGRHEYVIFSHNCRKQNILQFLDTRKDYGKISFSDTIDELENEEWYNFWKQEKTLIISPQAGFGNRLRALSSGIATALKENRTPYYLWEDFTHSHLQNLRPFTDFFEEIIPKANLDIEVDEVLSEWIPGDGWYSLQSSGQRKFNCSNIKKIRDVFESKDKNVLLETSLTLNNTEDEIISVYQKYFKPNEYFMNILSDIQNIDVGISIRRGNLLDYFPESRQSKEDIISWINSKFQDKTVIIFSDDLKFREEIKTKVTCNIYEPKLSKINWEIAFTEFLILSYKCNHIYGTPMSSFCEEAGKFGGKRHYNKILS